MAEQPRPRRGTIDGSYRPPLSELGAEIEPPGRARRAFLTVAFAPMAVVAALPVTALVAVVASVVSNVTTYWIGFAVLVVAGLLLGYITTRMAVNHQGVPPTRGIRRWLPLATSIAITGFWVLEIVSGSHAPDPVIVLCFLSVGWIASVLPLAGGDWNLDRWLLWTAAPAVTLVGIAFVVTQGFFAVRFALAVDDFDAYHASGVPLDAGDEPVGGFTVHQVHRGPRIGGYENCDTGMWITGWHESDTRYLVHCSGTPDPIGPADGLDLDHLSGDWWELDDKIVPPDLR